MTTKKHPAMTRTREMLALAGMIAAINFTAGSALAEPSPMHSAGASRQVVVDRGAPDTFSASITGVVHSSDGTPIADAVIVSAQGGQAVSDTDGAFTLHVELPRDAESLGLTAVAVINGNNQTGNTLVHVAGTSRRVDGGTIVISAGDCEPAWLPTFGGSPGLSGNANAMTVFDDGTGGGPALIVGGGFLTAGGLAPVNRIAKWDGEAWSPLGSGVSGGNPVVHALAVFDDGSGGGEALYVGGSFHNAEDLVANGIARWDGEQWSTLDVGLSGTASALAVYDDGTGPALFVGGNFATAGGEEVNHIAKWDGTSWSALYGGLNSTVAALEVHNDGTGTALYVGGGFQSAPAQGISLRGIARWDGVQWSQLDDGVSGNFGSSGQVHALAVFDGDLYAGGYFSSASGTPANRIAKWNGFEWSALGSGVDDGVFALSVYDDGKGDGPALYVGGSFQTAGDVEARRIARWDGNTWSELGAVVGTRVRSMAVFDDGSGGDPLLYMGGTFSRIDDTITRSIATWDGGEWSSLTSGIDRDGYVRALTVFDDGLGGGPALYAGGDLELADGVTLNSITKWDGEAWSTLGSGVDGDVRALAVFDDGSGSALYVGGAFSSAGDVSTHNLARWDGAAWSEVGSGVGFGSGNVRALAVYDDGLGDGPALYVGGRFPSASGVSANNIARWNGKEWSNLGNGVTPTVGDIYVAALKVFDDGTGPALYVGGRFAFPGGRIARWNGETWSNFGGNIGAGSHEVSALAIFDDGGGPALYAGGNFPHAGGTDAENIAKWDGEAWSAVGSGIDGHVKALTTFNDGTGKGPALYAGGDFTTAGGVTVNYITRWDGESYTALNSGISDVVRAFNVLDDGSGAAVLRVGGEFTTSTAGDSYLAAWQGCAGVEPIPGDLNGDGVVDVSDLLILLSAWGTCADPGDCPADLNDDGVVDVSDLLILLGNWG